MNNRQRAVICGTIALAILAFLFPPWKYGPESSDFSMGFAWILSPPHERVSAIDVGLLAIEETIIIGAGFGLYLLFGSHRN